MPIPEILLILASLFYNPLLGIAFMFYCTLSLLSPVSRIWKIDFLWFLALLAIAIYNRNHINLSAVINQPLYIIELYKNNSAFTAFEKSVLEFGKIFSNGLYVGLLLFLFIKFIRSFIGYYRIKQDNHLKLAEAETQKQKLIAVSTFIGVSADDNIYISDKEFNQHCLIIGTTGAGKTTTILNVVNSVASRGLPCIYLDGKGSPELIDKLRIIASKHNRPFKVFALRPNMNISETAYYNPFSSGTATEWKNRIMSLFAEAQGKGQEHFSLAEQNYINFVSNVLHGLSQKENQSIDLKILLTFLENRDLLIAAANKVDPVMATKLGNLHNDESNKHMAADVVKLLELFIYSSYGHLFDTDEKTNIINIRESVLNGEIVLFLFDASAYLEDTKKIAKMVINDINSCFASFDTFTPAFCIFDEFASYASSNLSETISLQRSKGLHAIIGTQSIASVKLKSVETRRVAEELIACCNTYIIQMLNHNEDAELFAKVIGTQEEVRYTTTMYDRDLDTSAGPKSLGSAQLVDKYIIPPQQIKDLKQGEAILYRKAAHEAPIKIKINCVFD